MFFSNKDLRDLIIPLFVEQFLLLLVGMADTFVVSYAGDAAVSGVSLVNSFTPCLFSCLPLCPAAVLFSSASTSDAETIRPQAGHPASFL